MAGAIDGIAHIRNPARDPGGRFVVHDAHRLDRVLRIRDESRLDGGGRNTMAPIPGQEFDGKAQPGGELVPQHGEVTGLGHEHAVARRQRVDERRLPRAGSRRRIDDDGAVRLEHFLHPREDRLAELPELGAAMIDRRGIDCAQHAIRHVGRAGNLQEMAAGVLVGRRLHGDGTSRWYLRPAAVRGTHAGEQWGSMLQIFGGKGQAPCSPHPLQLGHDNRRAPFPCRRRRRVVRRRVARTVRDRRVDLPGRTRRRPRPEVHRRRARGDRDLPRGARARAPARGRQLAMRADRRRRAGDRPQQAPLPDCRLRS